MSGVAQFLLGGALGAALGFLISRRQARKGRDVIRPQSTEDGLASVNPPMGPRSSAAEPVTTRDQAVVDTVGPDLVMVDSAPPPETPSFAQVLEPEPVSEPELSLEPKTVAAPEILVEPEPQVAPTPEQSFEAGASIWEEPTEETTYPAIEVDEVSGMGTPVARTPPEEERAELDETVEPYVGQAVEPDIGVESEVVVTPELLEEPLPGAGWQPSVALAGEEEAFEEILPLVPEEPEPYVAPEATFTSEVESPVSPVSVDDLKARIEATRRRIRQELEQPFVGGGETPPAENEGEGGLQQVIGGALIEEPLVPEESLAAAEAFLATSAERSFPPAAAASDEMFPTSSVELGVDYDSMRSRIEATRSRLKAKAFDAMMAGESALLGRGAPDTIPERSVADVDREIDQTIETTLREEELS